MEPTLIPPEGLTEGANILLYIVSALLPVVLPIVTKLIDKRGFIDRIPTNFVMAGVALLMIIPLKFVVAPELTIPQCFLLVGALGLGGGTLIARGVQATNKIGRRTTP